MAICGSMPTTQTRPTRPVKKRAMKTGTVAAMLPRRMAAIVR